MSNDLNNLVTPEQIKEYEHSEAADLEHLSRVHSLQDNQVSTAINAAWRKRGMQGHVTSTLFRESAVTNVHMSHKEMKSDLADFMAHKDTTAQRFYRLKEREEACLQAASCLPHIMRSSEPKQGIKRKEPVLLFSVAATFQHGKCF